MYRSNDSMNYGFRIVGDCRNDRRLIDWPSAFTAYRNCDDRAQTRDESYLSAFCFGDDFRQHLTETGSTKGYKGPTWAPWLWFDIDADDIDAATADARTLATMLIQRFSVDGEQLMVFYSGSKGFHVGLPTSLFNPEPSLTFHAVARKFAETIATEAGVTIDTGVYDRVRAFRAPNSRHPKTGRYKRFLRLGELMALPSKAIVESAETQKLFELPRWPALNRNAVADWGAASLEIENQRVIKFQQVGVPNSISPPASTRSVLNRATTQFISDGAMSGDRHRRLFSAAANLAEFGCGFSLAWALLSEPAMDSGLSPSEVRRQIECGLKYWGVASE